MMIKQFFCIGILLLWAGRTIQAQDTWSLEQCINYAWKNNPQVLQNEISQEQAAINAKQAKWAQVPTINGSIRYGVNIGRSVDLTSYQFINEAFQSTGVSLNVNAPIYQGLTIRNTIQQTRLDQEATRQDLLQIQNDLALSTAQAYLTVLLAEENVEVLREQAELTKAQYDQTLKLIDAGVVPDNNRFDLEAQMAMDEENILLAENNIALAYLNLKTVMNIDIAEEMTLEKMAPVVPENVDILTLEGVYDEALSRQPSIVAARIREESAMYGVKIAKGRLQPSVSAYVSLNSNYSSLGRKVIGNDTTSQPLTLDFGGTPVTVDFPVNVPIFQTPYGLFPQLGDNLSQGIGLNVNIPILNGWQTRASMARAELAVESAKLNTNLLEVQLKADVQRALLEAQAAKKRLEAAEKSAVATRASVENTQKRYELGVVNAFELTSVQNRLVSIESNVLQAKYDYIFKLKVLDFYRGQALTD